MKIHIHPDYQPYAAHIRAVAKGNYRSVQTYCNRRNTVVQVVWEGKPFVVKRFKRPTLANCVIYTWLRKTKAQRAYEYAEELLARGIETARPVAYIECRKHGFFHTGYFISEYLPYPLMENLQKSALSMEEKEQIGREFIAFTADLHAKGIMPKDFNPGNIFFHREGDHYRFALIDINRLRIGKIPNERESIRFFNQLGMNVSKAISAIDQYASLRGFDTDLCLLFLLLYRIRKNIEGSFKQKILHPLKMRVHV